MGKDEQYRINEAEQQKKQEETAGVCKYCGATIEEGFTFCVECGQKVDGEEHVCPVCKATCTSEYCPHCGFKVIPTICPKCGAESHYDFCEQCGEVLNDSLKRMLQKAPQSKINISEEEIEKIKSDFDEVEQKEDINKFLNKIKEHKILLEERDFFNKREKRIIKLFGKNPMEFTPPDLDELAFKMNAYKTFEKVVFEREERIKKETLDILFPKIEADIHADEERIAKEKAAEEEKMKAETAKLEAERKNQERLRQKAEVEARLKVLVNEVSSEVKDAKFAEQKRLEEERRRIEEERRRQEEIERKKREQERIEREKLRAIQIAEDNKLLGTYVSYAGREDILKIERRNGSCFYGEDKTIFSNGDVVISRITGTIYGNRIEFDGPVIYEDITFIRNYVTAFSGTISSSGHHIIGSFLGCGYDDFSKF